MLNPTAVARSELITKEIVQEGLGLLRALMGMRQWLHRRVDTFEFVDADVVRHRASFDFTLPAHVPRLAWSGGDEPHSTYRVVPLTSFVKRLLVNFDLRDPGGHPLPLLTTVQNSGLSAAMLGAATYLELGQLPQPATWQYLRAVVAGDPKADALWLDMRAETESLIDHVIMARSSLLRGLIDEVKRNFLLYVPIAAEPGERRIVKLGQDVRVSAPFKLRGSLGFRPRAIRFATDGQIDAESFHFEFDPPPHVLAREPVVELRSAGDDDLPVVLRMQTARVVIARRVHVHLPRLPNGSGCAVKLRLVPERAGWLNQVLLAMALVTSVMTVGTVGTGAWSGTLERAWQRPVEAGEAAPPGQSPECDCADPVAGAAGPAAPTGDSGLEAPAAVLLSAAAAIAGFLTRPGEHAVAGSLLSAVRLLAALVACVPIIGAAVLVFLPRQYQPVWVALNVFVIACLGIALRTWWRSGGGSLLNQVDRLDDDDEL